MTKNTYKREKLQPTDFEKMFKEKLSPYVKNKIKGYNFIYSNISENERDKYLKKIMETLLANFIVYAGKHRHKQWEKGWGQNLTELKIKKDINAISPHYFGKYDIIRINQKFIKVLSKNFERDSLAIIINWLADKYMRKANSIYEFGCGTGHHLQKIREINSKANIYGLDWVKSSQEIIRKVAKQISDDKLFAHQFDFFNPDNNFELDKNSIIYTVAALEQVGDKYDKFINYIIKNKPKLCIHIEPIEELLDKNNLLDYLSIEYFKKRKYLSGFLNKLRQLEKSNKIRIIKAQRTYIGSLFIDGYSVIIWSPK